MAIKRDNEFYEIEAVSKAIRVLEAVEPDSGKAMDAKRIVSRTGFTRDFVGRALKTWELNGYVVNLPSGKWIYGKRFLRFGAEFVD